MEPTSQLRTANSDLSGLEGGESGVLAALSEDALTLISPHLRKCDFRSGDLLSEGAGAERQIYFPHWGLVSIAMGSPDDSIEVANVSREAAAGLYELVDQAPATHTKVLVGGAFSCISAHRFAELEKQSEELAAIGIFCRDWILLQAQHMAVCNASHSAEARFARWLLLATERMECEMLPMTQEDIAGLLGIRRTTVTLIAQKLQNTGVIRYSRGKIAVRDPKALQAAACDCCGALGTAHWPSRRGRSFAFSSAAAAG